MPLLFPRGLPLEVWKDLLAQLDQIYPGGR